MNSISVIDKNSQSAGLIVRTQTQGPELDFTNDFIEYYKSRNETRRGKFDIAIYVEPKIDSGYPDVVIAHYSRAFMDNWSDSRRRLTDRELKVLSYLLRTASADIDDIVVRLGFSYKEASKSIELLSDCHIVTGKTKNHKTANITSYFGINKLIAVETKIGNSKEALCQAIQNTRYASHSYALLDSQCPKDTTVSGYRNFGVGIFAGAKFSEILNPIKRALPTSYVALKFNEWIGRQLVSGEIQ
jgi:predicted transcriptional regulator